MPKLINIAQDGKPLVLVNLDHVAMIKSGTVDARGKEEATTFVFTSFDSMQVDAVGNQQQQDMQWVQEPFQTETLVPIKEILRRIRKEVFNV